MGYPNKMDRISKLPVGVIETILCLLPIQEAARTSILSKEWRYHWIKIPNLVFIEDQFQEWTRGPKPSAIELRLNKPSKRKDMAKRCRFFYAIYQVLLMHEGPIHEFTLSMEVDTSCVEIDHIILHLSKKNTLKILKLDFEAGGDEGHRLPISLFSLHQLTSLYLNGCALYQQRSFNEYGCLTTLYLRSVWTHKKTLHRLLSSCPLLKRLTLGHGMRILYDDGGSTIVDLFECVPVIEYLYVTVFGLEDFLSKRLPKKLPTSLVHLKYLCVDTLCFTHIYGLPFLALLIRSSPNLEKLKLLMWEETFVIEDDVGSFTLDDYSDIMLEHLKEFEIQDFTDSENELDFVRLILAKSPVLKKMTISPHYFFDKDEESVSQVSEILFCSPCASPVVEIIVGPYKSDRSCPW
ncbi:putative FBD domain, leucine-rich repeat domain superfamily, F-box-like domain superfamily [Helianthus annuus]|uniref:FBD domain, leucine-rich repeat domain superfamily, F-box-like domain superfamily n=2 Tax=Helianthus annuus TaxID=4232 RepID=A0A9K3IJ52_HELAN|nr:F-box/FBD/LRR-repeat protein At1g13570 isoform X2 [Helianthus annuus]XP_021972275.1 F-box/FBD/LRR-repeat protein At1g13570 isoform X2 [Helianthus annuus]XP_021972276.1 F-box/FBD/LRR-repeat protein At1g13570 isoform X2 [Helianthus annuus]XP_035831383.1 F-box/FBD/LRR-repeat protein At1g13570 isoform X2 [Helianthus annuus]KAF5797354.1 putative FBD domain, leucine-rich repeat domain superfamily, F-box-like domain superfamily [Helianthus annuus]KAJ0555357.1 putative FBD domain, leucine-rich repe